MSKDKSFEEFNGKIRLPKSKRDKLEHNRNTLRDKVKKHFKERNWKIPRFYPQGSFPLQTNLNPIKKMASGGSIKEKYDLDYGVYFICPISEREKADTYHGRVNAAVARHASEVKDKNTCVRVVYEDGHHIDLPIYWMESKDSVPKLAHKSKGFVDSDPKAFGDWVNQNIQNAGHNGQLRRIIRYLKAWKDSREDDNASIKLPSGFILTILACNNYMGDESDPVALKNTVENIENYLSRSFSCHPPTPSEGENLLAKYDQGTCLKELRTFSKNAADAVNTGSGKQPSECWTKIFGGRFPSGGNGGSRGGGNGGGGGYGGGNGGGNGNSGSSGGNSRGRKATIVTTPVQPLWARD